MLYQRHYEGIVRARSAAARTLAAALRTMQLGYSERRLMEAWHRLAEHENDILPFGWYQPPPCGISVLIGAPPAYERLNYKSLRNAENFPSSEHSYTDKSAIIYPYFSAVDRTTMMIGDHVATYYAGNDKLVKEWIKQAYHATRKIVSKASPNIAFCELYQLASDVMRSAGASNNNFSIEKGLAADIGHTVPFFGRSIPAALLRASAEQKQTAIAKLISEDRRFVSADNTAYMGDNCAFTIEPQMVGDAVPMASFHFIVAILEGAVHVIDDFQALFDLFGMTEWLDVSKAFP